MPPEDMNADACAKFRSSCGDTMLYSRKPNYKIHRGKACCFLCSEHLTGDPFTLVYLEKKEILLLHVRYRPAQAWLSIHLCLHQKFCRVYGFLGLLNTTSGSVLCRSNVRHHFDFKTACYSTNTGCVNSLRKESSPSNCAPVLAFSAQTCAF